MDINNLTHIGGFRSNIGKKETWFERWFKMCPYGEGDTSEGITKGGMTGLNCTTAYDYESPYIYKCCRKGSSFFARWVPYGILLFIAFLITVYLLIDCKPENNKVLKPFIGLIKSQTNVNWFLTFTLSILPSVFIKLLGYVGFKLPFQLHFQTLCAIPFFFKAVASLRCGDCEEKTRAILWASPIGYIIWILRLILLILSSIPGAQKVVKQSTKHLVTIEGGICWIVGFIQRAIEKRKQINQSEKQALDEKENGQGNKEIEIQVDEQNSKKIEIQENEENNKGN